MSIAVESIDNPSSAVVARKKSGFLSTLASYLTSTAKSEPKPAQIERKKLMSSWDDVDLLRLNQLVVNVLNEPNNSCEPLLREIERMAGKRREHCVYAALLVAVGLVLLHDAIGAVTAFVTLILPVAMTIGAEKTANCGDFATKYWTVYAVFVATESFFASLIQWDLRILRLLFMSMCLSSRVPILTILHEKILTVVARCRQIVDKNNYEPIATLQYCDKKSN